MSNSTIYNPSNGGANSSGGAMIQANMYAWAAEGLGRVDISSAPEVSFEYADMQQKDKSRIINPLAHIQFATGLRPVRGIFSVDGVRYTNKTKDTFERVEFPTEGVDTGFAGNPLAQYEITTGATTADHDTATTTGAVVHNKFLLKPKIDNFSLIPKLVADMSVNAPEAFAAAENDDTTAEFIRASYVNFTIDSNAPNMGRCAGAAEADLNSETFYVYDMSNNGDDGSFNVIATFKIYAKYNDDNSALTTTKIWPGGHTVSGTTNTQQIGGNDYINKADAATGLYRIDGIPITTHTKDNVDVSFIFTLGGHENGSDGVGGGTGSNGLKKIQTGGANHDISYIAHLMGGSLIGLKFSNGGLMTTGPGSEAGDALFDISFLCTRKQQGPDVPIAELIAATHVLDFSYTGLTLESTGGLELNDDEWIGDLLLPITGDAVGSAVAVGANGETAEVINKKMRDAGGLQCIHIPDSIRTLRNDAAQSLAANFAGLSELLGSISITHEEDISMGEFNFIAHRPGGDAKLQDSNAVDVHGNAATTGASAGSERGAHGVFRIPGDILKHKLKNFMLGYNGGASSNIAGEIPHVNRQDHIHKVVYWCNAVQGSTDISIACTNRDNNLGVPDLEGGTYTAAHTEATEAINFPSTAADASCGAFITELTPQESAFFYIYPWASTEMCAIGSGPKLATRNLDSDGHEQNPLLNADSEDGTAVMGLLPAATVAGSNDLSLNPFRQYQHDYITIGSTDKIYSDNLEFTPLSTAVPTVKGWLDNRYGYYNTAKKRTEWYSFVDICFNNNMNGVQQNDISYVYQALGATGTHGSQDGGMTSEGQAGGVKPNGVGAKGAVNKSVLDIIFPDIADGNGDIANTNNATTTHDEGSDFCQLNFRVPLEAIENNSKKRLNKVSNLHNGVVQLANESHELKNGFTAKVNATADNLSAISANVNELMNSYCPVIIRLMDENTIGASGHNGSAIV